MLMALKSLAWSKECGLFSMNFYALFLHVKKIPPCLIDEQEDKLKLDDRLDVFFTRVNCKMDS